MLMERQHGSGPVVTRISSFFANSLNSVVPAWSLWATPSGRFLPAWIAKRAMTVRMALSTLLVKSSPPKRQAPLSCPFHRQSGRICAPRIDSPESPPPTFVLSMRTS